jgi:hypothetical protein
MTIKTVLEIKEIENIFPVFLYTVIETLVVVWEHSKYHGKTRPMGSFSR